MRGTVTVGEAPPPPPPPPSEQPFPNDTDAPTVLEVVDEQRPRLSRVRAAGRPHGIRVRFRLSEAGRVTVRVRRGGRLVASRAVRVRRGAGAVYVGDLRPGRYRLAVRARDLARNASRTKRASATVR